MIARHTAQAGRQPARRVPAPHPRGPRPAPPRRGARSACTATTPTGSAPAPWPATAPLLEERAGVAVEGVRYHYLRCLYHETLPLVEKAGFAYDTSLAFAEHEGFRCGASFPFRPYGLDEERPLRLLELPLAVMDTTLTGAAVPRPGRRRRRSAPRGTCWRRWRAPAAASPSSGTTSASTAGRRRGYDDVYWRLVDWARGEGAFVGTAGRARAAVEPSAPERRLDRPRRPPLGGPPPRRPAHLRARVPHARAGGLRRRLPRPGGRPRPRRARRRPRPVAPAQPHDAVPRRRRDRPGAARACGRTCCTCTTPSCSRCSRRSRPSCRASSTTCTSTCPSRWRPSPTSPSGCGRSRRRRPPSPSAASPRWATAWSSWCPTSWTPSATRPSCVSCCPTTRGWSASTAPRPCPSWPPTRGSSWSTWAASVAPAAACSCST